MAYSVTRSFHQVRPDAVCGIVGRRVRAQSQGACREELWFWYVDIFMYGETDSGAHRRFDGCATDLAITLRCMSISHGIESAGSLYRQVEPRPLCQVLRIHVATMAVGWDS